MHLKHILFLVLLTTFCLTSLQAQVADPVSVTSTEITLSQPFPNPASQSTTLRFELGTRQEGKIVIYNLLGTKIKTELISQNAGEIRIPVADLQNGIYFLRLEIDGIESLTRKLKVMR